MKGFWITCLFVTTAIVTAPPAALSQAGGNSAGRPAINAPVGDFDPPRNNQIKIIDDGPVIHDYRYVPSAPVIQKSRVDSAYEDLWKSTCERSPDIQFITRIVLALDPMNKAKVDEWLANVGKGVSPEADLFQQVHDFDPNGRQAVQKNAKKHLLNESECVAIFQMAQNLKEKLVKAYLQYTSTNDAARTSARSVLVDIAGPAAVAKLDQEITK